MNSTSDVNLTFYDFYSSNPTVIKGPIIWALILLVIVIFGLIGNTGVIFLTYYNSQLKNTCNYLLALLCLSDCVHQIGHFSYIYRMLIGSYFLDAYSCFIIEFVPLIGLILGVLLPMLISLDRFCCFFFSKFHRRISFVCYTTFVFVISSLYVGVIFYAILLEIHYDKHKVDLCFVPYPVVTNRIANLIFQLTSTLFNFIAVMLYLAVYVGLNIRKHVSDKTRKAFKALTAVIAALLFGWISASIGQLVCIYLGRTKLQMLYIGMTTGTRDYRKAFQYEFKRQTNRITSLVYAQ
ncbi:G protein-coupled receptor [Aphelenchoides besseyi]|nr:G protein-coupled receptor [Aphelenchoides besseyi]